MLTHSVVLNLLDGPAGVWTRLFTSCAEIGFAWYGEEKGWIRAALLPSS